MNKKMGVLNAASMVLVILVMPMMFSLSWAAGDAKPIGFDGAQWIWLGASDGNPTAMAPAQTVYLQQGFEFPAGAKPVSGEVLITCDNQWTLFINGKQMGQSKAGKEAWMRPQKIDIRKNLIIEQNSIAVKAVNSIDGPAGLIVKVRVVFENGKTYELSTDGRWLTSAKKEKGWNQTGFTPSSGWLGAKVIGGYGVAPWRHLSHASKTDPGHGGAPAPPIVYGKESAFTDKIFADGVVFVRGYLPFVHHDKNNFVQNIHGSRAYFEMDPPTPAAIGRQLVSLIPFKPDGKITVLCDADGGVLGSPSVSYDGKTVYFSFAPKGQAYYHIFAVDVGGGNLRQVTDGPFHDYDPAELPDGRIVFSSTRIGNREEYHAKFASSLFTCDQAGNNILPLTYHIAADREPRVTASGLAFIRMDNFLERAKVETHLHQTRMDGTGGQVIIGPGRGGIQYEKNVGAESNSNWLRKYGTGSCAAFPDGKIIAINQKGVVSSTSSTGEPLIRGFVPYDMSPLPDGRLLCTSIKRTRLLVFDPEKKDVTEILAASDLPMPTGSAENLTKGYAENNMHSVVHLAARSRPMPRPSMVDPKADRRFDKTGFLYCQNVLNTQHRSADLKRIKAVRIYQGKPFSLEPTKTIYAHIGTEGVELGTVPLALDGSFYVEVPADRPLAMQAVDAEGRPVLNEMSWIYVRPGEQRSCVGCHAPASSAPTAMMLSRSIMSKPLKLIGQGDPHRFRANNGANGGVLNLQLERFRQAAAINLPDKPDELIQASRDPNADIRLSGIRRMGILHNRAFADVLCHALINEKSPGSRCAAALSLSACGDRKSVAVLSRALNDPHATVRNAVRIALENLTGSTSEDTWRAPDFDVIERQLMRRLSSDDPQNKLMALQTLGHVGGECAKKSIREFVANNPDAQLRVLMTAIRSLGYLKDTQAVDLLIKLMQDNLTKKGGGGFHELGYGQKPIYISATAAEALGLIGTAEAEKAIVDAFSKLNNFSDYVFRVAEHSWLKGCHASILHFRMLEALDRMESKSAGERVGKIVESLPADKDRGLLYERDSYEAISARVIARSGMLESVIQACFTVLDGETSDKVLVAQVGLSPHAHGHIRKYSPQARAAQVLSIVCNDQKHALRIGGYVKKFRSGKDSETRNWCCFYLIRTLGRIGDQASAEILLDVLANEPTETEVGLNTPPTHIVYKGWRPFFRPAAAWGLGMLKEKKAQDTLLEAVANLDNAPSVRRQAAIALGRIGDKTTRQKLVNLAEDYPEVMTRRCILESIHLLGQP
ncbi:MAG: HEAT repeat domain-containing protein [Verrucomicrobiae bacterium]|nr:HEAT repeat domain-containing protein [Verrucomicrobiae bacterium]NNJ43379.1 hypothetical protein [Akkermansiaceae bacterium]